MPASKYDLLILGGGNAGVDMSVACLAASRGLLRKITQFAPFAKD